MLKKIFLPAFLTIVLLSSCTKTTPEETTNTPVSHNNKENTKTPPPAKEKPLTPEEKKEKDLYSKKNLTGNLAQERFNRMYHINISFFENETKTPLTPQDFFLHLIGENFSRFLKDTTFLIEKEFNIDTIHIYYQELVYEVKKPDLKPSETTEIIISNENKTDNAKRIISIRLDNFTEWLEKNNRITIYKKTEDKFVKYKESGYISNGYFMLFPDEISSPEIVLKFPGKEDLFTTIQDTADLVWSNQSLNFSNLEKEPTYKNLIEIDSQKTVQN